MQDTSNGSGREDASSFIMKLVKERESYREKLRIAKSAIQIRDGQLEKMKKEVNILPLDMSKARLHLAFLFSSPLIRRINNKTENIMQLDYLTEINDIIRVCSRMKYEMKFRTDVATVSNMRSMITDGPVALHFSGHGIQNLHENIGNDYVLHKDKGNILL